MSASISEEAIQTLEVIVDEQVFKNLKIFKNQKMNRFGGTTAMGLVERQPNHRVPVPSPLGGERVRVRGAGPGKNMILRRDFYCLGRQ